MRMVTVARKPLFGGCARNVVEQEAGALNIEATRIEGDIPKTSGQGFRTGKFGGRIGKGDTTLDGVPWTNEVGRWPSNVLLLDVSATELDQQSGHGKSPQTYTAPGFNASAYSEGEGQHSGTISKNYGDSGASRFFKVFRTSASKRS